MANSTLPPQAEQLLLQLRTLGDIYQDLLSLGEERRQALVCGNIEILESLLSREKALQAAASQAESVRKIVYNHLQTNLQLPASTRFADVIVMLPAELAEELRKERERLTTIIEALQMRSRNNQALLDTGIQHLNNFMKTIQTATAEVSYGPDGKRTMVETTALFCRQA